MSNTTTISMTEMLNPNESNTDDPMFDSGFSSGSLRLSLHGSLSEASQSDRRQQLQHIPTVKMPSSPPPMSSPLSAAPPSTPTARSQELSSRNVPEDKDEAGLLGRQDSCLSQDMTQLSLSADAPQDGAAGLPAPAPAPGHGLSDEAWQEYYEPDEDGDVQLHLAIASGFVEVVYALIRMAPHPNYLSIQNHASYAPLHIAVLQNQPALVRRLVVAGARLDVRDREGNTPLHLAARRGHLECGEALLKPISVQEMQLAQLSGPTLYTQLPVDIMDLRNGNGEHCVHLATMGGHAHFLRFLCWNNVDINVADGRAGRTALHFAVGARNMDVIQALAEPRPRGCGINVNLVDWYGRTAYQLALLNGAQDIAQFLARSIASCDLTPFDEQQCYAEDNDEDEDLCEADDWNGERSARILLNSSA